MLAKEKMSGPYIEGLGKRRRKSEDSTSTGDENRDEDENFFFEEQPLQQNLKKRRRVTPTDAELIPKFRPDNKTSNVSSWLHKIDQLGDVYGWDTKDRQFIMQLRLGGSARDWYDDLENYDLNWEEWKKALQTAFPRSTDFVDRLEQMLTRTKGDAETMTKYYHEKLSLIKKCEIDGEKANSCIIRGLPHELRANAKAYRCDTPEELYYGYLSSLENFKRVESAYSARKSTWRRGGDKATVQQLPPKICYACRRPGHEARDCRASQRCETCHRLGHTATTCWFSAGSSRSGALQDREAWRGTIMLRSYDKQAEYLTWGPQRQYRDDYHMPNGVLNVPTDIEKSEIQTIPQNKYRDPGHYLEAKLNGVKSEPEPEAKPDVVRGLASALLQVSQGIHHKYLKRPLGLDEKERKDREARNKPLDLEALERWEVSLMESRSFASIVLHLFTLDSSVTWSASILNASCRLCRRKTDPDNMLLCDGCNKGHHLYCLKPKLTKVPAGDWFCDQCKPKERTPRKRRKLFSDEDIEEELNSGEESETFTPDTGVCGTCGSGGRLATCCQQCGARYHTECALPRPARSARRWLCAGCLAPTREVRRCAATAISNIHQYTRALDDSRNSSESEDSDYNTSLVQLKTRTRSKEPSPLHNGTAKKRGRKSKEEMNTSRKSKASLTNGVHEESSTKKRGSKAAALHTEALHQLLADVMKHKDCWAFYEPVSLEEVPDYLEVIEQPMDFSTIKEKLEAGEYSTDQQLIDDAALVLVNCFTYNQDTHPVARSGTRLEKYINKRCSELELPPLPEINLEAETEAAQKRRVSEHTDAPRAKKPKLK